jgi:[ribosomal protein S5]-alanine N-acetyltransferase
MLSGAGVTLRPLHVADAASLVAHFSRPAVSRYIAPPPASEIEFSRFIRWTHTARGRGAHVCFGIVPARAAHPVGIIQLWPLVPDFSVAEWGFVLSDAYWGTGTFAESAGLVLDFAFTTLDAHRIEARAAVVNGRGNGALKKLGAVREAYLRRGSRCGDRYEDHHMWAILRDEWMAARGGARS